MKKANLFFLFSLTFIISISSIIYANVHSYAIKDENGKIIEMKYWSDYDYKTIEEVKENIDALFDTEAECREYEEKIEMNDENGTSNDNDESKGFLGKILSAIINIPKKIVVAIAEALIEEVKGITSWIANTFLNVSFINHSMKYGFQFEKISSLLENKIVNIINYLRGISIGLMACLLLKQILMTWLLWKDNPDENPLEIIIRITICMAIIYSFEPIYDLLVKFFIDLSDGINNYLDISTVSVSTSWQEAFMCLGLLSGGKLSTVMLLAEVIIKLICIAILCFQFFKAFISSFTTGVQIMILRMGIPFATLGLLGKSQFFENYIKQIIKGFFTITINVILMQIAFTLIFDTDLSFVKMVGAFAVLFMINKGGELLNQIIVPGHGGGYNPLVSNVATSLGGRIPVIGKFINPYQR